MVRLNPLQTGMPCPYGGPGKTKNINRHDAYARSLFEPVCGEARKQTIHDAGELRWALANLVISVFQGMGRMATSHPFQPGP